MNLSIQTQHMGSLLDFTHFPYYHREMARQLRLEYEGTLYHITPRGNARVAIYLDDEDRTRFPIVLGHEVNHRDGGVMPIA